MLNLAVSISRYGLYRGKMVEYLLNWVMESGQCSRNNVLYNIINIPDPELFVYRLYWLCLLEGGLRSMFPEPVARKIIEHTGLKIDISSSSCIFYEWVIKKKDVYSYEFEYSNKKCKKCGGSFEIREYQIRRADEPKTQVLTCINCGYRITSCE